ncbi:hypothetical protein NVV31_23425 [Cytobacillus firmus]|uniref:hypothetical protein n=1 Tax=Cytobacillus firmus TaxID=1399 RepID=UPI0021C83A3D|nr:hypothetical protein [Cytobacillus firmus]MCU1808325.1 hypothetical protein [Cytobacillus firmus]
MESTIYRILLSGHKFAREVIVNEDNLCSFLHTVRNCPLAVIMGPENTIFLRMEQGNLIGDKKIKIQLQEIEQAEQAGNWSPLSLYQISYYCILHETVYLYAKNRDQAKKDFLTWSIFEPDVIVLVA